MIAIRADAGPLIGAGHVMRCLSIAAALKSAGEKVALITADGQAASLIERAGIRHIALNTDWKRLPEETGLLVPLTKRLGASLLLVDSYLATPEYIKELKQYMAVACLDDLQEDVFPADLVINYNITADRAKYETMYRGRGTVLLLGTEYVPLRPEFRRTEPPAIQNRIRRIFLSAGGGRQDDFTAALADRLLREKTFDDARLVAAPGVRFGHGRLQTLSQGCPRLELLRKPEAVKEKMETCDAAVSAGGLTLYELCACGVPTAVFSLADNQSGARKAFCARGIMADCGDLRNGRAECLRHIAEALSALEDPAVRFSLREKAFRITDGLGAGRIASVLAGFDRSGK